MTDYRTHQYQITVNSNAPGRGHRSFRGVAYDRNDQHGEWDLMFRGQAYFYGRTPEEIKVKIGKAIDKWILMKEKNQKKYANEDFEAYTIDYVPFVDGKPENK